jgi:hypothetical protein
MYALSCTSFFSLFFYRDERRRRKALVGMCGREREKELVGMCASEREGGSEREERGGRNLWLWPRRYGRLRPLEVAVARLGSPVVTGHCFLGCRTI